jgi:hypothetical protein
MKRLVLVFTVTFIFFLSAEAENNKIKIGTTFSQVQCEYLGLDWRQAYKEVIDMGFDIIRLGAYWGRIQKKENEFDFSELDWQIKKAAQAKTPVLLTVGMKAPRWPEFFIPNWLKSKINLRSGSAASNNQLIQENVIVFIGKVIKRYQDRDIIIAWQVENEPLSRSGPDDLWIAKDFLIKEINLVKDLDSRKRPVVVNAMTYPNKFLRFLTEVIYNQDPVFQTIDVADIPALNIYSAIGHKFFDREICFFTEPQERVYYLQQFVSYADNQGKPLWVTELQAEPWEPGELVHTGKEQALTCSPQDLITSFKELRSLDVDAIFLWGVEYWLYRHQQYQVKSWIKAFRKIYPER